MQRRSSCKRLEWYLSSWVFLGVSRGFESSVVDSNREGKTTTGTANGPPSLLSFQLRLVTAAALVALFDYGLRLRSFRGEELTVRFSTDTSEVKAVCVPARSNRRVV